MVTVKASSEVGAELKKEVDEDIARFDAWFRAQGNDPVTRSEQAIISTYLWWKTQIDKE